MTPMIVVGHSWSEMAQELAKALQCQFVPFTVSQFADTETFISVDQQYSFKDKKIILFFQFQRPGNQNPSLNDQYMGLLQLADIINQCRATSISLVFPYAPYARQDVSSYNNLAGAIFTLGTCLKSIRVSNIFALELHNPDISAQYPLTITNIQLHGWWREIIQTIVVPHNQPNFCIVSPDEGGVARVKNVARELGVRHAFIRKTRIAQDKAIGYELVGDVKNQTVILLDDIIDTAHTALSACQLLMDAGAAKVYACITHAILSQNSIELLTNSSFEKIFVSNTIHKSYPETPGKITVVPINDFIVQQLVNRKDAL